MSLLSEADAKRLELAGIVNDFDIIYQRATQRVWVVQKTTRAEEWAQAHATELEALQRGLMPPGTRLTDALLVEIQRSLTVLVATTGFSPVRVGLAEGQVYTPPPAAIAAFAREGLAQLLQG